MGQIGEQLVACFKETVEANEEGLRDFVQVAEGVHDIEQLVRSGHDPLHAVYIQAQNLTSLFAEDVSQLDELDEYAEMVGDAEDTYMPDGPPISPLTRSYFTTWAFFDMRLGPDEETIGTCLLELADVIGMDEFQTETIHNFQQTRMGIYEHVGTSGSRVRLRELVTGKEFLCHATSGYRGKKGELWYVRLCPPIAELADYYIVLTTPYILSNASENDWTAYLNKNVAGSPKQLESALDEFLKYGPKRFHWHEFLFQAYHHHQFDAIFLAGLPDVKGSLPHAD